MERAARSQHPSGEFGLRARLTLRAVPSCLPQKTPGEKEVAPSSRRGAGEQRGAPGSRAEEVWAGRRRLWGRAGALGSVTPTPLFPSGAVSSVWCRVPEGCCDSSTHYCFAARAVYLETLV